MRALIQTDSDDNRSGMAGGAHAVWVEICQPNTLRCAECERESNIGIGVSRDLRDLTGEFKIYVAATGELKAKNSEEIKKNGLRTYLLRTLVHTL